MAVDSVCQAEMRPWLPPEIIDCHVHINLAEHNGPISAERLARSWAAEVGTVQSWEELADNRRTLFPDQRVTSLVFGCPARETDIEANNAYVLQGASDPVNNAEALYMTRPELPASAIADAIGAGFLGIKPYPSLSPEGSLEVSIYDFLPREHLSVLNELHGILMLHLPRVGRLGDPDNIREALEIYEAYPSIKMVIAHIGRAYCLPTAERGLPHFADATGLYFDTSANLNPDVFECALETVGPERLLYGSDLPIMMMRGVREYEGERYINYTDGPYSWNVNRKSPEEEAKYTYYLYEELRAILKAVERTGAGKDAVTKIMYSNAAKLLGRD